MAAFREIDEFPGYGISDDGKLWTRWERKYDYGLGVGVKYVIGNDWLEMKPSPVSGGYLEVSLRRDGKAYHRLVHRLVLEAFVGPCPPGMECLHGDNVRNHNRLTNLRWGTKKENQNHRRLFGTAPQGEGHGLAKLTDDKVREIRRLFAEGVIISRLAEQFGISRRVVGRVVRREQWSHVA